MKKPLLLASLALAVGVLPFSPARLEGATIQVLDTTISALADPGGIVGDGANTTVTPGWVTEADPTLGRTVVGVGADLDRVADPTIYGRALVQFAFDGIEDGFYDLSVLFRTVNLLNTPANGARDQSFAISLNATGGASINGTVNGSTGWLIVTPTVADYSSGGHRAPWLDLILAGGTTTDATVSGLWDTTDTLLLLGGNVGTGGFRIDVLDGTGRNYGLVYIDSFDFTFVSVPEPSTWGLAGMALLGAAGYRQAGRRRSNKTTLPTQ